MSRIENTDSNVADQATEAVHVIASTTGAVSHGAHATGFHLPGPLHKLEALSHVVASALSDHKTGNSVEDTVCGAISGGAEFLANAAVGFVVVETAAVLAPVTVAGAVVSGSVAAQAVKSGGLGAALQDTISRVTKPVGEGVNQVCHAAFSAVRGANVASETRRSSTLHVLPTTKINFHRSQTQLESNASSVTKRHASMKPATQASQSAAASTLEIPDALSEKLMTLIGETTSIEGFEQEETVTTLFATLHHQIENKAPYSDIISTKTQLDLEKVNICSERKQFDRAIQQVKHTVNIASSLAVIFGNDRLAGQIASAGNSVLTIGNAFAGIAGVGLLAAASPLELGATLLSGIAGLVGLFREEDSGPNLAEILIPMLHAISQQISQFRMEMHERFDRIENQLNEMQRTLLESLLALSREVKLEQKMILHVIAKIDSMQMRQDVGFSQMHARFDQLGLQINNHAVQTAFEKLLDLQPIARAKDDLNHNVHFQTLLAAFGEMKAYHPALTGKSYQNSTANDLQMPGVMLSQTLSSMVQAPLSGNPLAIIYSIALLKTFIEVHLKTDDGHDRSMARENARELQAIDERHIRPLRQLIIALRQMPIWDQLLRDYERSAAEFKSECENHLRKAMALQGNTEGLRLRSNFSINQLQRTNDHEIFMRQEIPIRLDCYLWRVEFFEAAGSSSDDWRKDVHLSNMYLQRVQKTYVDALHKEAERIRQGHLSDQVFMRSTNTDFLLPLTPNVVNAIPASVLYLQSRKNFNIEFTYQYDSAKAQLTIIGLLTSGDLQCEFFKKSFSNPLHYKEKESLWWFWMGGNVPENANMQAQIIHPTGQHPMRHSHVCKYEDETPIFSQVLPLRDRIDFSNPADQVPLSPEIQRIYDQALEQELLQLDAHHITLQTDAKDTATPLGLAYENLNRAYLFMKCALEFLETVSPCDIWQSNLLHELTALPSAERILADARVNHTNAALLFAPESTVMHFADVVRIQMQKQFNNSRLFFDELLAKFFEMVEQCAATAQDGPTLKDFDDAMVAGIGWMIREVSSGRMTAEQMVKIQSDHIASVQAIRSGEIALTPVLINRMKTPQITAPPVVSSATLFQPAAIPLAHSGNAAASSAAPI